MHHADQHAGEIVQQRQRIADDPGVEQQVRETLNWPFAAALSFVLLAFTFAVYALAQRFTRAEGRA